MRNLLAIVKNVVNLQAAYDALENRDAGVPGMGLVHGFTGAGKSTAVSWLINRVNGVFVRAAATWTPSAMLSTILREQGREPSRLGNAHMVDQIAFEMRKSGRPLFVDESDYLLSNIRMIETLRDLHDMSASPVVLIGMEGIEKRLVNRPQLAGRISQWVQFRPAELADAMTLAQTVCEVELEDDLIKHVHAQASGSMRNMTVGFARIEQAARAGNWKKVDLDKWGNRQLFLSRAPATRA